jgi:hypothetical protein
LSSRTGSISCRPIGSDDVPAIVDLLQLGFPRRSRTYWLEGLQRLARHAPPEGFPQFGYMLDSSDGPVGVHLLISSGADEFSHSVRCNVSSWFVKEPFRVFGGLLIARATRRKSATYMNIGPKLATVPTIQAQGFRLHSSGVFAALPQIGRKRSPSIRLAARPEDWAVASMSPGDRQVLTDHASFGCISLWCESENGAQPLVFRRRRIKPGGIPCAQLIYCRSPEGLEEVWGPVGRFLARRGMALTLVPANRPLRGVTGRYFPQKLPIYFKGEIEPRVGDLSYTEVALFGM